MLLLWMIVDNLHFQGHLPSQSGLYDLSAYNTKDFRNKLSNKIKCSFTPIAMNP